MNGQQLKNSILQMAVQGKLVPQDPNDEPASALLERIRKEKEQLIKEGKIKKEKNPSRIFRGADNLPYEQVGKNEPVCIADEVPFEIPDSWELTRLSFVCQLQDGIKCTNKKLPILGARFLRGNEEEKISFSGKFVPKDAKIILVDGENSGEVFKAPVDGYLGSTFKIMWSSNLMLEDYLQYFLLIHKDTLKNSKKGAAIPHLNKELFFNLIIPIPPVNEQNRIVSKLRTLEPFIEKYTKSEKTLEKLNTSFPEQFKKSILQQAVMGKLVPQDENDEPASVLLERIRAEKQKLIAEGKIKKDKNESVIFRRDNSHYEKLNGIELCVDDEIPFEIPESWEWVRLKNLVKKEIKRGKSPEYAVSSNIQVFAQKCNVKAGGIDMTLAKYLDNTVFPKYPEEEYMRDSDIVVNSTGNGTLGRIGMFHDSDRINKNIIVPDSHVTVIRTSKFLLADYIFYVLNYYQPYLEKSCSGSTNQTELKPAVISELFIPVPPINEQRRIVNKLSKTIKLLTE